MGVSPVLPGSGELQPASGVLRAQKACCPAVGFQNSHLGEGRRWAMSSLSVFQLREGWSGSVCIGPERTGPGVVSSCLSDVPGPVLQSCFLSFKMRCSWPVSAAACTPSQGPALQLTKPFREGDLIRASGQRSCLLLRPLSQFAWVGNSPGLRGICGTQLPSRVPSARCLPGRSSVSLGEYPERWVRYDVKNGYKVGPK